MDKALTWPSDTRDTELTIIDFEVLFHYRSLRLPGAVDRREKVLRIDFVVYPLVAGEANACQQNWYDYEVTGMSADNEANFVKRAVQEVVDARQVPHLKKMKVEDS